MEGSIPQGRVRRTAKLASAVGTEGARVAATMAANLRREDDEANAALMQRHLELATRVVEVLGTMKGAAMKVGQLASFVEIDFVPEEFRPLYQEQLAKLRDAAPPEPWPVIEKVLRQEWGRPVAKVLAEVEQVAAAAASVGQVHRAVLEDGRVVAVKVQYPGVEEAIRADLQNVGMLTRIAKLISPGLDASAIAQEVRERVLEELDYELEATNQRAFARAYRGHPFIRIPQPHTDLSTRRVLVAEWVDGDGFDAVRADDQAAKDRFAEIAYRFYFGSLHRMKAFNADPHPGNMRRLADGTVAFLDYGTVKHLSRERVDLMVRSALEAAANDADALAHTLDELGYLARPDKVQAQRVLEGTWAAGSWYLEDREVTIDAPLVRAALAATTDPRSGYFDIMRAGRLPPEDVLFGRMQASVTSVLAQLGATGNWHRIAQEFWTGADPSTELGKAEARFWR